MFSRADQPSHRWLASLPLFWAVLPAITLSGIPDYAAIGAVGKRTLTVILGPSGAVRIAQGATLVAALMAVRWQYAALAMGAFAGISLVVLPHAAVQTLLLEQYRRSRRAPGRIDGLMMLSLFYIVWFVAVPLCRMVFVAN